MHQNTAPVDGDLMGERFQNQHHEKVVSWGGGSERGGALHKSARHQKLIAAYNVIQIG